MSAGCTSSRVDGFCMSWVHQDRHLETARHLLRGMQPITHLFLTLYSASPLFSPGEIRLFADCYSTQHALFSPLIQGWTKEMSPFKSSSSQCSQAKWPAIAQPISQFRKVLAQFSQLSAISLAQPCKVHTLQFWTKKNDQADWPYKWVIFTLVIIVA